MKISIAYISAYVEIAQGCMQIQSLATYPLLSSTLLLKLVKYLERVHHCLLVPVKWIKTPAEIAFE